MKQLLKTILNLFIPRYQVVYTAKDGNTEMYTIAKPQHRNEFGNMKEGKSVVGFKAWCYNKEGIRSFRYDRITSLNRA
jgi:phage gp16-like protein